ncbi:proto-oncogene Mas-like [Melanerpes formicivorus]|uniref:proto-oncogene Mas-like n=1 Tax=Melanerpes formicivorus TaxID=211600 RepID=UPI00358DF8EF
MKKNPFTVYVLNLAIADFSLLLILLAKFTLYFIPWVYCIDYTEFHLANAILFVMFLFCYLAGMYLLTAMSVERCLAAVFPVCIDCYHTQSVLSIVNIALFASIPLLSNLALFIKLRCGSQRRHPGKLYVAVLLSVLFVVLLGFPFSVEIFISFYYPKDFYVSFLLASLNSSINPVIYFLVGSCQHCRIQCSIRVAFQRLFDEGATSEERSHVPGDAVMETSV